MCNHNTNVITRGRDFWLILQTNQVSSITLQPEFGVVIAEQDADLTIAIWVLGIAKAEPVTAVAEEKNIIVLHLYHFQEKPRRCIFHYTV